MLDGTGQERGARLRHRVSSCQASCPAGGRCLPRRPPRRGATRPPRRHTRHGPRITKSLRDLRVWKLLRRCARVPPVPPRVRAAPPRQAPFRWARRPAAAAAPVPCGPAAAGTDARPPPARWLERCRRTPERGGVSFTPCAAGTRALSCPPVEAGPGLGPAKRPDFPSQVSGSAMARAKWALLAVGVIAMLAGTGFVAQGGWRLGGPPEQPIAFPHDVHAGTLQIP